MLRRIGKTKYRGTGTSLAISSISPNPGPAGSVTITGTGFIAGATVSFGGSAGTGVTVVSSTQITVTAPAHADGAVTVTVTTSGGTSNGYIFTYQAAIPGSFFDDFNGAAGTKPNPANWGIATNSWTGGAQTYRTEQVFLDGASNCVIRAEQIGATIYGGAFCGKLGGSPTAGAPVPLSWGYGRLEARIKMPHGFPGMWPAWWFLGQEYDGTANSPNGWPYCGEMDICEFFSDSTYYYTTSHGPGGPNTGGAYNQSQTPVFASDIGVSDFSLDYHVYWCQRSIDTMVFGVDNLTKGTFRASDVISPSVYSLNKNVFPIFDFMLYDPGGGVSGLPANMLIDWVRFTPG